MNSFQQRKNYQNLIYKTNLCSLTPSWRFIGVCSIFTKVSPQKTDRQTRLVFLDVCTYIYFFLQNRTSIKMNSFQQRKNYQNLIYKTNLCSLAPSWRFLGVCSIFTKVSPKKTDRQTRLVFLDVYIYMYMYIYVHIYTCI